MYRQGIGLVYIEGSGRIEQGECLLLSLNIAVAVTVAAAKPHL